MATVTPMMRQYLSIKNDYPDTLLFFRLGDFYEMFYDDAKVASKELDLVLTSRDCGQGQKAPMCGVPFHSVDNYLAKLVSRGYKVAICEQMEDPATTKNIVKREVVRTLTPGTIIESTILDEGKNNYLASFFCRDNSLVCVFVDISTAEVYISSLESQNVLQDLINEFAKYTPSEILIDEKTFSIKGLKSFFELNHKVLVEKVDEDYFDFESNREILLKNISGISDNISTFSEFEISCLGACINYLSTQYKTELKNISSSDIHKNESFMYLNLSSRRNLELNETMRSRDKKGSLLWVLDKTKCPLGKRKLRSFLDRPLLDINLINARQDAVQELFDNIFLCEDLRDYINGINDLERIMTRVLYGSVTPKELRAFCNAVKNLPFIKHILSSLNSNLIKEIYNDLDTLEDLFDLVNNSIEDEPPNSVRDGKIIKKGFSKELDELKSIEDDAGKYINIIEQRERERTGIPKIKISFNRVFGYYIEVTNLYKDKVPEDYIRKQTLTNCERFITQELKELENKILSAKERVLSLEFELFCSVRDSIASQFDRVHKTCEAIAQLDALCSLAYVAKSNNYCRPEITNDGKIFIFEGRHPVVEKVLENKLFVPNNTLLDEDDNKIAIITGPNMAGKSTYMRQVAILVIMAQIGSFIPATSAKISICDSIFTRVGASDDLASGQSTFMVEMNEVAEILTRATKDSLIIYDEIGRGTSTYDGMSIARAVLEFTCNNIGAKTLFATHYHELTEMENTVKGVMNFNAAVKKNGDDITFLHSIDVGPADGSYGVEVSKLAGVPDEVVERAKQILSSLEHNEELDYPEKALDNFTKNPELGFRDAVFKAKIGKYADFVSMLKKVDIENITPIEAISKLNDLVIEANKMSD